MGKVLDPYDIDFANDIAELSEQIADLINGRNTQYLDYDGNEVEGYSLDTSEFDNFEFPVDADDRSRIAEAIAEGIGSIIREKEDSYRQMHNPGDDDYPGDDSEDESSVSDPLVWFEDDWLNIVL